MHPELSDLSIVVERAMQRARNSTAEEIILAMPWCGFGSNRSCPQRTLAFAPSGPFASGPLPIRCRGGAGHAVAGALFFD